VTQPKKSDPATTWALRIGVAVIFSLVGVEKFSSNPTSYWVHVFNAIGFGQWFRYFTGIVEMLGGLLFLIPAATTIGAAMLIATMCGAMLVHLVVFRHPGDSIFPGLYLIGIVLVFAKLRGDRDE
jgi:putative oxidoreductase